jgi:hypothetical protein
MHPLMYILQYHNYPTDIPTKYSHNYMIGHISMQVTTTTLP